MRRSCLAPYFRDSVKLTFLHFFSLAEIAVTFQREGGMYTVENVMRKIETLRSKERYLRTYACT